MQVKTITTVSGVNEIDFGNDSSQSTAHFYWLKNLSDSTLYVSANPNPIAEKDDVAELPAKGAVSVETDEGKIYVLGAGKVEIHRTNSKFCPFDWQSSGSGGGGGGSITVDSELSDTSTNPLQNKVTTAAIKEVNSAVDALRDDVLANTAALETKSDINHIHDISASGNPIIMDNLQGGVPFSEMVVSGKNLLPYPYYHGTSRTENGITFTVNDDGTITANGTSTNTALFRVAHNMSISRGKFTISGCPSGGSNNTFKIGAYTSGATELAIASDYGSGSTFAIEETQKIGVWCVIFAGQTLGNLVFRPQLELGDTATAYEPPITGRELQANVSGKNMFDGNLIIGMIQTNTGIMTGGSQYLSTPNYISVNGDCTYSLSNFENIQFDAVVFYDSNKSYISATPLNRVEPLISHFTTPQNCKYIRWRYSFSNGASIDMLTNIQLELGDTATEYEPYHGSTTTISPTSNPYTIPNDISQQEGLNIVSVSEGELSVVGVQKNAAIKRIWDDMSMDLLFDGLALVASPAENINLGNYSKYLINCYDNVDSAVQDCCISIVVEYDRLKHIVDIAGLFVHSLHTSYTLELHFSGTMDNANYYAKQANKETAAYYTRIYGIK